VTVFVDHSVDCEVTSSCLCYLLKIYGLRNVWQAYHNMWKWWRCTYLQRLRWQRSCVISSRRCCLLCVL